MRLFSVVFAMIVITILFGSILNKTNTIEQLENQLEQNTLQIDSLLHEIDTLQWENQIWDFNVENNTVHLLSSIMFVESNYNDSCKSLKSGFGWREL